MPSNKLYLERRIVRGAELKLNGKPLSLYIDHAGFSVTQERVAKLEAECKTNLPPEYKEFLLAYNGVRLIDIGSDTKRPILSYVSNILEVSDFDLQRKILEGVHYDKNSVVLIGSNHDGSLYTFMVVQGTRKGEIFNVNPHSIPPDIFQGSSSFKSFPNLLQAVAQSEYAKLVSKSPIVQSITSSSSSSSADVGESPPIQLMPINSQKFPLLSDVVNNLFDTVESEENEHGRIVVKKKEDTRKVILIMTYIRDTLHKKGDNDIQSYMDFFSPFKMYLVAESELEELMKEGLINENDDITKKGIEEAEKIILEESQKLPSASAKINISSQPAAEFKGYVDVVLSGKTTPMQLTRIGTVVNEARVKKFEKAIGTALPKDYREFMLAYNGGTTKQVNLKTDGSTAVSGVKVLRDLQNLEDRLQRGESHDVEWMAIGTDKNECLVYLNLRAEKRGFIYRYKSEEEGKVDKNIETMTGSPQQLLAKSFLDFVMNVVAQETKEERIDDSSLDSLLSDEVKTKYPQLIDVMRTVYESVVKQENSYGRITLPNKQDVQNVVLLVSFVTSFNSESFVAVLNRSPFRFFTILDSDIDDMKKAKLLSGSGKLTKKGKVEAEKLLSEAKVIGAKPDMEVEAKKGKETKKEGRIPRATTKLPQAPEKPLKRKLEDNEGRSTRSSTKEGAKKR